MMLNYLKSLWIRLTARNANDNAEVEQIARLQLAATARRNELADLKRKAELAGDDALRAQLSVGRRRVEEAETAHLAALQHWENKQARQRSY